MSGAEDISCDMKVKFYGVRGSIPCPGPKTQHYGGNTACIELRFPEIKRQIIIDAGSGLRELGNDMMANDLPNGPINTEIYLSHTHWDHIMGFPFFVPAYIPGTKIKIFGPITFEDMTLEDLFSEQMNYRYFPVKSDWLGADIVYERLKEDPQIDLGDGVELATAIINHPITTLGYRFRFKDKIFCTAYDTEPFHNPFVTDPDDPAYDELMAVEGEAVAEEQNRMLEKFYAGADLLVHDAQYTLEEYEQGKKEWGHTPIEDAIKSARRAGVKRLALFHHDPERGDDELDRLGEKYCSGDNGDLEVFFAREGLEIEL